MGEQHAAHTMRMKHSYKSSIHHYFLSALKSYELYGVAESQCLPQMHFAMKQLDRLENEMRWSYPDTRGAIKNQVLDRFPYQRLRLVASQLDQSYEASGREYIYLIEKALSTYVLLNAECKRNIYSERFRNAWIR